MPNSLRTIAGVATIAAAAFMSTAAFAADYVAKIGHLESTQQSRHIMLEKVSKLVAERTNGAVEFQLFPQGQLGNQRQMTEGVQLGVLEATVSPAAFLGGFNPAVSILDIPFLLPADEAKAEALREGPFGQALLASFDQAGVKAIALWPNGRKHFTSNEPIETIADFEGQKFRAMDSKILIEQFNAMGASAVALPFGELYTSLQTGVVEGEENPLDTIQRMKFNEVQKNLLISGHGAMEDVVLFNPIWWSSLPAEYQATIVGVFKELAPEMAAHKANAVAEARTALEAAGMHVTEMSAEDKALLKEKAWAPTVEAYLSRAGDTGAQLIELYEAETGM